MNPLQPASHSLPFLIRRRRFLGGLAADYFGMRTPFVICAILVLGALAFQGWVHRRGFLPEASQPTP